MLSLSFCKRADDVLLSYIFDDSAAEDSFVSKIRNFKLEVHGLISRFGHQNLMFFEVHLVTSLRTYIYCAYHGFETC